MQSLSDEKVGVVVSLVHEFNKRILVDKCGFNRSTWVLESHFVIDQLRTDPSHRCRCTSAGVFFFSFRASRASQEFFELIFVCVWRAMIFGEEGIQELEEKGKRKKRKVDMRHNAKPEVSPA